jgi:uncharacterized protein (DUF427 family)
VSTGHTLTTEATSARVQVTVRGAVVADSTHAVLLHETGLPVRYYLPRADVDMTTFVPTETTSHCPFKGDAVYWSATIDGATVADVAWSYPAPIGGRADIAGLVCFFDEKVDAITVDGVVMARPETPWSVLSESEHP